MTDILYSVDKECTVCNGIITVTKVRNRLSMVKRDSDFCTYYQEVNPYYYGIWVCPHCGYAAQDTYFGELAPVAQEKIKLFLSKRTVNVNFSGERTWEQGVAAYKLAIFFAELIGAPYSRLAGLYLKLAWLYREAGQEEEEQKTLIKAREDYEQALLRERLPIGNMSELMLEYLIGELFRRTGMLDNALSYLGKVVSNPKLKLEKRLPQIAKDAWHQARDAKKQAAAAESHE